MVTIIIPVYKTEATLDQCVRSVLADASSQRSYSSTTARQTTRHRWATDGHATTDE